ncbi:MAG TPA: hypothetical protein DEP32_11700 [Pseudomonas sp.]|nr:hypothetical protein [Pseudomonas sp.]MBB51226.1 hypothetical protein [Pseudomonadales bacterium]MBB52256.1 hypothetical protein [Pseudomonadales bacterium]HCA24817.1 hypothetical protein [Pseudomonas sp.]|tara:strand:+ start:9955 stop:10158 length:204 start_codon:yes stop_codon:yes gene_type:complete
MTGQAIRTHNELIAAHAAHAANIALLLRTPPEGEAARFRQQKTIDNLRNQMLAIDIQLMREECAEGV